MMIKKNRIGERGLRIGKQDQESGIGKRGVAKALGFSRSSILAPRSCEGGFSLVSAIFLLVVIAALGTFAVTLSTTQQQSDALDVLGARGYQAARAGIEWSAYQVANSASNALAPVPCTQSFAPNSMSGTLSAFTVTVNCAAVSYVEGAATIWIYDISAVAVTGGAPGSPGYIERDISAKMGR